jgi:pimeloyl-ACP methyl ester carboxylesterase/DNA-binding CsgD family transcriptional regulator
VTQPSIQYARTDDGVNIAYYSIGEGPPLVYLAPISHLEAEWRYPEQRAWLERLAEHHRLIRLDFRGSGLSDRDVQFEFPLLSVDVDAVVRKERLKRFAVFGGLSAAAAAILHASRFREDVSHLILWCPYVSDATDLSPTIQAVRAGASRDWGTFLQILAELLTGWRDMKQARRFAAYLRQCVEAHHYQRNVEYFQDLDLTKELIQATMPALVLQTTNAAFPTVESARRLATSLRSAKLVLLEGSSAVPFLSNAEAALSAILEFLSEPSESRPHGLTTRELEILTLLSGGTSNQRIARALSISTRTVDRHIGNIYLKIGAHNRAEATAYAYRHGIVPVA